MESFYDAIMIELILDKGFRKKSPNKYFPGY